MASGIYAITNMSNGKVYIGQSVDLSKRWRTHQWSLNNGRHFNPHLQRAWDRGDEFKFSVIEECSKADLNDREIYWISYFHATEKEHGYNLCIGGSSTTGRKCSKETRKKISEKNRGKKLSAETLRKRSDTFRKRMEDPVYRERHHKIMSEVGKKRGSPWNKGRSPSAETRKKVSEKLMGRYVSEEHKEKLRELYSGSKSITAKLTEQDVVQIRLRFLSGERQCDIHKDYPQITTQTLYDIVRNRRWKSVPNTIEELEEMEMDYGA